jgi:hypothetical protein
MRIALVCDSFSLALANAIDSYPCAITKTTSHIPTPPYPYGIPMARPRYYNRAAAQRRAGLPAASPMAFPWVVNSKRPWPDRRHKKGRRSARVS